MIAVDVAIGVLARQLMVDLAVQAQDEGQDGYDHTGILNGLSDGQRSAVLEKAVQSAQLLGPSPEVVEAAQRTLAR